MLDGAGDDVDRVRRLPPKSRAKNPRWPEQPLIAWLLASPAAGEDDLVRLRPDQCRDLPACGLDRVVRGLAVGVRAGGVAEVLASMDIASTTAGSTGVVAL